MVHDNFDNFLRKVTNDFHNCILKCPILLNTLLRSIGNVDYEKVIYFRAVKLTLVNDTVDGLVFTIST